MAHKLGVSGSVILSDPELFSELFWKDVEHIEIGEFPDETALDKFLGLSMEKKVCFGIHSPLLRGGSKYDLVERVQYDSRHAWRQLENEAEKMSALGAKYLLVHFPYFKDEIPDNAYSLVENGLKKLSYIQRQYSIEMVCEPKLGLNRSPAGIDFLNNFPKEIWMKYNINLCIDIGDYIIGVEDKIFSYMSKWKELIRVVHLHNVYYEGSRYIWIPVHPAQEQDGNYKVEKIIRFLAQSKDITFVFEHTPDTKPSKEFVAEGYKWVKSIIE